MKSVMKARDHRVRWIPSPAIVLASLLGSGLASAGPRARAADGW